MTSTIFIVVMGVSGSGKSTVGKSLAETLGWPFYDADAFHPEANVEKMSRGIPLTDADRLPWLERLHQLIGESLAKQQSAVLAASSLKESYRKLMQGQHEHVQFVYLKGSYDFILQRMQARQHHFMKPEMLKSQFATLEEPQSALTVSIEADVPAIVQEIIERLHLNA